MGLPRGERSLLPQPLTTDIRGDSITSATRMRFSVHTGNRMSYSELARFFDNFHMPLLPPEVNERFLLKSLGLD
jgi:hypothetical protein